MDTSATYIEMSLRARRFLFPEGMGVAWSAGDWFYSPSSNQVQVSGTGLDAYAPYEEDVALLRQDQLQEMIQPQCQRIHEWIREFAGWATAQPRTITHAFDTFEQLWLAFVMKEKYGKVWDGEDWNY